MLFAVLAVNNGTQSVLLSTAAPLRETVVSFNFRRLHSRYVKIGEPNAMMDLLTENRKRHLPDYEVQGAKTVSFSPYSDNGG